MASRVHVETPRLKLRDWIDADAEPYAAINADPRVMEFFPAALTREQSDVQMAGIRAFMRDHGYGLYAAEEKATGRFIGFIGLSHPSFEAHFTPAVEIGWRLAREAWGEGYATEGARAVVAHAFGPLGLGALVSFTAEWNRPSRRVMEKIGMTHDPADDFQHPRLPTGHKLSRHVLYRLGREQWQAVKDHGEVRHSGPSRNPG
jgi:RimJ/RimL family protein N-acetyltransferase